MVTTQPDIADLSRVALRYREETAFDTDPGSVAYTNVAFRSESLKAQKPSVESENVNSSRRTDDIIHTSLGVAGDIVAEMMVDQFDDWWEALSMGTWVAQSTPTAATNLTITNSGSSVTLTRTTGSFVSDGWAVGDWALPFGFVTNPDVNDRPRKVSAVSTLVLTLEGAAAITEGPVSVAVFRGKTVTDADVFRSYHIEKDYTQFTGTRRLLLYSGCAFASAAIQFQAGSKFGLTFSVIGVSEDVTAAEAGNGSPVAALTNRIVSPASGVKLFMEGGAGSQRLVSTSLNFNSGLYPIQQAGQAGPIALGLGKKTAGGSFETFVEVDKGLEIVTKYHDEVDSAYALVIQDPGANYMIFDIPKIHYTDAQAPFSGGTAPGIATGSFSALAKTEGALDLLWRFVTFS